MGNLPVWKPPGLASLKSVVFFLFLLFGLFVLVVGCVCFALFPFVCVCLILLLVVDNVFVYFCLFVFLGGVGVGVVGFLVSGCLHIFVIVCVVDFLLFRLPYLMLFNILPSWVYLPSKKKHFCPNYRFVPPPHPKNGEPQIQNRDWPVHT